LGADSGPKIDAELKEGKVVDSKAMNGHLRFDNIHFRYPTRPTTRVLRNLLLEVEPGTYIALVGASGSGKSRVGGWFSFLPAWKNTSEWKWPNLPIVLYQAFEKYINLLYFIFADSYTCYTPFMDPPCSQKTCEVIMNSIESVLNRYLTCTESIRRKCVGKATRMTIQALGKPV
jgi:ABC-type dipeptide/oligopeptide/nickel transport system ATPase subunit